MPVAWRMAVSNTSTKCLRSWNRITTVGTKSASRPIAELAEVMAMLPDAADAARRLKRVLQSVFESHYSFDLEFLKKQNLGKAIEHLEKFNGVTSFAVAYVTQNALAGHAIPLNAGVFEILQLIGVITESEAAKQRVPGMERAIPKNKGVEFSSLLHQFGVDYSATPHSPRIRAHPAGNHARCQRPPSQTTRPRRRARREPAARRSTRSPSHAPNEAAIRPRFPVLPPNGLRSRPATPRSPSRRRHVGGVFPQGQAQIHQQTLVAEKATLTSQAVPARISMSLRIIAILIPCPFLFRRPALSGCDTPPEPLKRRVGNESSRRPSRPLVPDWGELASKIEGRHSRIQESWWCQSVPEA